MIKQKNKILMVLLAAVLSFLSFQNIFIYKANALSIPDSIDDAGIEFLKKWEGIDWKCRWDEKQMTIGYGTKCGDGTRHTEGIHTITQEEAENLLRIRANGIYVSNLKSFCQNYNISLNQNQFNALISFSFNLGENCWTYSGYPSIQNFLKEGDYSGEKTKYVFGLYNKVGGKVNQHQVERRAAEAELFLSESNDKTCTCNETSMAGKYVVSDSDGNTNVRKYENSSSEILCTIPNGTIVTVNKGKGNWYYVEEYGGHCYAGNLTKYEESNGLKQPILTIDKEYYSIGETVHISWEASSDYSNLSHYWLIIDGPNGTLINKTMGFNTSYDFVLPEAGSYLITAFATPKGSLNGEGSLTDSAQIFVDSETFTKLEATADEVTINRDIDQSATVFFTYRNIPSNISSVDVTFSETKEDIVKISIGQWDGNTLPVTFKGDMSGETDVTAYLKDTSSGSVLAAANLHITVKSTTNLFITQFYYDTTDIFEGMGLNLAEGEFTHAFLFIEGPYKDAQIECSANADSVVDIVWNNENYKSDSKNQRIYGFDIIPRKVGKERITFYYKLDGKIIGSSSIEMDIYTECAILQFYNNGELIANLDAQIGESFENYLHILKMQPDAEGHEFLGWYTSEVGGERYKDLDVIKENKIYSLYARYKGVTPSTTTTSTTDIIGTTTSTVTTTETTLSDGNIMGDANDDGKVNVSDLVMLQKWLLCSGKLINWENVDINQDDRINVFDLVLLKRLVISQK